MSKWIVHIRTPYGDDDGAWLLVEAKDAKAAESLVAAVGAMRVTSTEPYDGRKLTKLPASGPLPGTATGIRPVAPEPRRNTKR